MLSLKDVIRYKFQNKMRNNAFLMGCYFGFYSIKRITSAIVNYIKNKKEQEANKYMQEQLMQMFNIISSHAEEIISNKNKYPILYSIFDTDRAINININETLKQKMFLEMHALLSKQEFKNVLNIYSNLQKVSKK